MYLAFDDIIYSIQKYGGASTYWSEITSRIKNKIPGDVMSFTSSSALRLFSPKVDANVFHSSHFRISKSKGVKNIVTIHDLIYEKGLAGGRGKFINLYERKKAVDNADAIICISESTKNDLLEFYKNAYKKPIHVIYHGTSSLPRSTQGSALVKLSEMHGFCFDKGNFFLFVGGRSGYKNFEFFLNAFANGKFKQAGYKIVCTGSQLGQEEVALIKKLGLQENIIAVGLLEFSLLGDLYAIARALIYPSLYEGFGLPPLEAMASGCPVICSKTSSLPEVVGDAGILIKPMCETDLIKALESTLNENIRNEMIIAGYNRAKNFNWDKTAIQHIDVYHSVSPK